MDSSRERQRITFILDLFLTGRMPNMNHARHVAIAQLLKRMPDGLRLMHLGLQATATRAGVPEKYSAEITERCWAELDDTLPDLTAFADVLPRIHLIVGPVGAGKSTFATELATRHRALRLTL